ncbi:MAG: glutamate racemase [Gammaproteobacteria bacterium]|nr:glutamate racemase [Gammaproteobacteria bacterium]MDH5653149.1 glutamate racemase [Gammaproteobacteria bacterium]
MNNFAPIGVFDSGIGGLSVTKEIISLLPNENLIYIADSGFAPYGNKPVSYIRQRCDLLTHFLLERGAKALVVACNTATAAAITEIRQLTSLPVIGMEPGVKPAIAATRNGVVGVLATQNTVLSNQFTQLVQRYGADVKVLSQPCPGLVDEIESGGFSTPHLRQLVQQYVTPLIDAGADTIVLGCTHYPLIKDLIAEFAGPGVTLIDTGPAVANQLRRRLQEAGLLNTRVDNGGIDYWTSGDDERFNNLLTTVMGRHQFPQSLPENCRQ